MSDSEETKKFLKELKPGFIPSCPKCDEVVEVWEAWSLASGFNCTNCDWSYAEGGVP